MLVTHVHPRRMFLHMNCFYLRYHSTSLDYKHDILSNNPVVTDEHRQLDPQSVFRLHIQSGAVEADKRKPQSPHVLPVYKTIQTIGLASVPFFTYASLSTTEVAKLSTSMVC